MSCFVLRDESIMTLANTISTAYLSFAYANWGLPTSGKLWDALKAAGCVERNELNPVRVAVVLYLLNVKAYNTRYREQIPEDVPDFKDMRMRHVGPSLTDRNNSRAEQVRNNKRVYQPWVYQLVALLDCYAYETAEDATYNDPIRLGIVEFADDIRKSLVMCDTRYPSWCDM